MFKKLNVKKLIWKGVVSGLIACTLGLVWKTGKDLENAIDDHFDHVKDSEQETDS